MAGSPTLAEDPMEVQEWCRAAGVGATAPLPCPKGDLTGDA